MTGATAASPSGGDTGAAYLGVERSLTGRRWCQRAADGRTVEALAQRFDLPEVLARVLAGRGIGVAETETFLRPTLRHLMPDPNRLRDMDTAATRLAAAVRSGEKIAVLADYDVDGATAAAVLKRFFAALGCDVDLYVPDRRTEGYGPNVDAFRALRRSGASLAVTVDCGVSAFEPIAAASDDGLEVIVVDHHQAGTRLPAATAIINPNRLDDESGLGHLAAVGVAFLLAVAVNRTLRETGWYEATGRREPDLRDWLDLVALGTVCDMVPLTGLNRAFVIQGLRVMARRRNPGLRALADLARVDQRPNASHLGFVFGPRINAGGRIGRAETGARLLASDDPNEVTRLARCLDDWNRERQQIESAVVDGALACVGDPGDDHLVWAIGEGWNPGVIGIVASRLLERFHRPVVVVAIDGAQAVGSGRSIAGIDLGAAVNAAVRQGVLVKGGGHAMAAGFTVARDRVGEAREFVLDHVRRQTATGLPAPVLTLDGALSLAGAANGLIDALDAAGPFGNGNPAPRFAFADATVASVGLVADTHVRCTFIDAHGQRLAGIALRAASTPLGQALRDHAGRSLHVAGRLQTRGGRGQHVQLMIDDAAWSGA